MRRGRRGAYVPMPRSGCTKPTAKDLPCAGGSASAARPPRRPGVVALAVGGDAAFLPMVFVSGRTSVLSVGVRSPAASPEGVVANGPVVFLLGCGASAVEQPHLLQPRARTRRPCRCDASTGKRRCGGVVAALWGFTAASARWLLPAVAGRWAAGPRFRAKNRIVDVSTPKHNRRSGRRRSSRRGRSSRRRRSGRRRARPA